MNRIKQQLHKGRYFDEERAFYDMTIRNHMLMVQDKPKVKKPGGGINTEANQEKRRNKIMLQQIKGLCRQALDGIIDEDYAIRKLMSEKLHDQYLFRTQKALSYLKYTNYMEVSND